MHSASAVDIYRAQRKHINYSIWPMRISRHDLRRRYSNSLVIDAGSQFTLRACSQAIYDKHSNTRVLNSIHIVMHFLYVNGCEKHNTRPSGRNRTCDSGAPHFHFDIHRLLTSNVRLTEKAYVIKLCWETIF
jgi:hypothetical protein